MHTHKNIHTQALKCTAFRRPFWSDMFSYRRFQTGTGNTMRWLIAGRRWILGSYTRISAPGTNEGTLSRTAPVNRTEHKDK